MLGDEVNDVAYLPLTIFVITLVAELVADFGNANKCIISMNYLTEIVAPKLVLIYMGI